jgi:hypothetical protein
MSLYKDIICYYKPNGEYVCANPKMESNRDYRIIKPVNCPPGQQGVFDPNWDIPFCKRVEPFDPSRPWNPLIPNCDKYVMPKWWEYNFRCQYN